MTYRKNQVNGKQLVYLFIFLCTLFLTVQLEAKADEKQMIGDFQVEVNNYSKTLKIIGYQYNGTKGTGKQYELVIPEYLGEYKVLELSEGAVHDVDLSRYVNKAKGLIYQSRAFVNIQAGNFEWGEHDVQIIRPKGAIMQYSTVNTMTYGEQKEIKEQMMWNVKVTDLSIPNVEKINRYAINVTEITNIHSNVKKLELLEGALANIVSPDITYFLNSKESIKIGERALYHVEYEGDIDLREGGKRKFEMELNPKSFNGVKVKGDIYDSNKYGDIEFLEVSVTNYYFDKDTNKISRGKLARANIGNLYNVENIKFVESYSLAGATLESGLTFKGITPIGEEVLSDLKVQGDLHLDLDCTVENENYSSLLQGLHVNGNVYVNVKNSKLNKYILMGMSEIKGEVKLNVENMVGMLEGAKIDGNIDMNVTDETGQNNFTMITDLDVVGNLKLQSQMLKRDYTVFSNVSVSENMEVVVDKVTSTYYEMGSFMRNVRVNKDTNIQIGHMENMHRVVVDSEFQDLVVNLQTITATEQYENRTDDIYLQQETRLNGNYKLVLGTTLPNYHIGTDNSIKGNMHITYLDNSKVHSILENQEIQGKLIMDYGDNVENTGQVRNVQVTGDVTIGAGKNYVDEQNTLGGIESNKGVYQVVIGEKAILKNAWLGYTSEVASDIKIGAGSNIEGSLQDSKFLGLSKLDLGKGIMYGTAEEQTMKGMQVNGTLQLGDHEVRGTQNVPAKYEPSDRPRVTKGVRLGKEAVIEQDILERFHMTTPITYEEGSQLDVPQNNQQVVHNDIYLIQPKSLVKGVFEGMDMKGDMRVEGAKTDLAPAMFKDSTIQKLTLAGTYNEIGEAFLKGAEVKQDTLHFTGKIGDIQREAFATVEQSKVQRFQADEGIGKVSNQGFKNSSIANYQVSKGIGELGTEAFTGTPLQSLNVQGDIGKIQAKAITGITSKQYQMSVQGNIQEIGQEGLGSESKEDNIQATLEVTGSIGIVGKYGLANRYDKVKIAGNVKELGDYALENTDTTQVQINQGVEKIGDYVFYQDEPTQGKPFPKDYLTGNVKIGMKAFYNNGYAGKLEIPDTVETIGNYAFAKNQFEQVTLQKNVTEIAEGAFEDNRLTSIKLPHAITKIGSKAFYQNEISCVTLPRSLREIGTQALEQKQAEPIKIYGVEQQQYFTQEDKVLYKENNVFENDCDEQMWAITVENRTEDSELLSSYQIDKPEAGAKEIEAQAIAGYEVVGDKKKTVVITGEQASPTVVFTYRKPTPPVEKPDPPTEPSEPPVEKPDPPTEPSEPPVEKPDPPTEPSEPPVEKPDPPTEPSEPPVEPVKPIGKPKPPVKKEEPNYKAIVVANTEKEETLPKTGVGNDTAGLLGLLLGTLGLWVLRKK